MVDNIGGCSVYGSVNEITIYDANTRLYYDIGALRTNYDPFKTYGKVYAELENRQYIWNISQNSKRFFIENVEKVTDEMTINGIIGLLGAPNFMQVEEIAPPDVNSRVFCVYGLTTVTCFLCMEMRMISIPKQATHRFFDRMTQFK